MPDEQAKLTEQTAVVLPTEIQPGDVLLTTADLQPRQVTAIRTETFPVLYGEEILVLEINEGCRRPVQVHCMELPVLVRRAS